MFSLVEPSRSRAVSRLALAAALSAGIAGCSSDFSRMTENPWASKPQASHQGSAGSNDVTGSVRQQSAPTGQVESQPLAAPTYGGGSGMGSYNPPQAASAPPPRPQHSPRPEYTGSISAPPPRQPAQSWSWDGGTAVVVAQGETIETISRRHSVPPQAILQANNMTHAGQLQPGQRLVIPRLAGAPKRRAAADARRRPELFARGGQRACRRARARRSTRSRATTAPRRWRSRRRITLGSRISFASASASSFRATDSASRSRRSRKPSRRLRQAQPAPQPQKIAAVRTDTTPGVKQQARRCSRSSRRRTRA